MAQGHERSEWNRASGLMALVANMGRDPKRRSRPFSPDEFNPLAAPRRADAPRAGVGDGARRVTPADIAKLKGPKGGARGSR